MHDLKTCRDEEQEYLDNIPENFQSSDRYDRANTSCSALNYAYDTLYDLIENIDIVTSSIEEAVDA